MAGGALDDWPGMPLELDSRDVVISRSFRGPFRMGAAVAGFTRNLAMSQTHLVEVAPVFCKPSIQCDSWIRRRVSVFIGLLQDYGISQMIVGISGMTAPALRQVNPGLPNLAIC